MGLAPIIVKEIFAVIKKLNESGTTILLAEQNAKAALTVAKRAFVLEAGEILLEGLATEL
jgi:branched-chain amino acid transport system ATP-binding protein